MNGLPRPPAPEAFDFLYATHTPAGVPVRYKVSKGGRGKGASWAIARRLIYKSHSQSSLILCTREVQNSIADSTHRLLKNQIRLLGYSDFFHITENRIRSKVSNSEFIFRGLNDLTADTLRSMEGVTDVWIAEAETTGKKSWQTLDPTIREGNSEIYVDYNPESEESPTNVMFTKECPDNAIVRHLTFADNPWFPEVLEKQRQQALARIENAPNEDAREQAQLDYNHVWLGHTKRISKASIFGAHCHVQDFEPHTTEGSWEGPFDGADWGFGSDPTVRVRVWIWTKPNGQKWLAIEREVYLLGSDGMALELRHLPARFDEFPASRTTKILADNSQPQSIGFMSNEGFRIDGADKWTGSVEDGIEHIRGQYTGIVIHSRCKETANEGRLYSYKVDKLTKEVLPDIVDKHNHCWDAVRYALGDIIQRTRGGHLFG